MAVLEEFGVGVSIQVDEKDLQEWPDPDPPKFTIAGPETKIVSKYIIPQDDREYTIRYNFTEECTWIPGDRHVMDVKPIIDGNKVRGRIVRKPNSAFIQGDTHYDADGTKSLYKFKFSGVETVDDASKTRIDNDIEQAKGLGQIVVQIWRVHEFGESRRPRVSHPNEGVQSEIAEKALKGKAISHGTSYSEPQPIHTKPRTRKRTKHSDQHPKAIFVFNYRSKAALQQEMIIPRTPEPAPERERDDLEGMSQEDIRQLAQRLLDQEKTRLKQEKNRVKRERETRVKRELTLDDEEKVSPVRPLKISRRDDGKMAIDLTDD